MTILSTGILGNSPFTNDRLYVPFKVTASMAQSSAMPFAGNRWERIRAAEKTANLIESSLRDLMINGLDAVTGDNYEYHFSFPVAFTPWFGNEPAKITVIGEVKGERTTATEGLTGEVIQIPPKKIASDVTHINANEAVTGQGSFNAASLDPDPALAALASDIWVDFSTPSIIPYIDRVEVMSVEVAGIPYGRRGRHL